MLRSGSERSSSEVRAPRLSIGMRDSHTDRLRAGAGGSVLLVMDRANPERQLDAAQITLARYTHALPQDILKARDTLAAYLTENQKARAAR